MTDDEARRLYSDYRGTEYNKLRLKSEPGYDSYIRMFDDLYSDYWRNRTNDLLSILRLRAPEMLRLDSILDFGGDGMIPSRLNTRATIYFDDLSAGTSADAPSTFMGIFASEVFEHLSEPKASLARVINRLAVGGQIVIDVPAEYSGSIRQEWERQSRDGAGSLVTMHEHINHFSIESLRVLMEGAGLQVEHIEVSPLSLIVAIGRRVSG